MKSYEEKSLDMLSSFYLTLVSIIEGLALGYLLQTLTADLLRDGTLRPIAILQGLTVLVLIILVWQ